MMFPYGQATEFMEATETTWNTETTDARFYFDNSYKTAGLLSDSPDTIYSSWANTLSSTLAAATVDASGGETKMQFSTGYPANSISQDLASVETCFVTAMSATFSSVKYSAPSFAAYVPIIFTPNGTDVFMDHGSAVTLEVSFSIDITYCFCCCGYYLLFGYFPLLWLQSIFIVTVCFIVVISICCCGYCMLWWLVFVDIVTVLCYGCYLLLWLLFAVVVAVCFYGYLFLW